MGDPAMLRPITVTGLNSDDDGDDDDANSVGAQRVLARLGVAMARANKNDDAAKALRQAILMQVPAGTEDAELEFQVRENFGMVVNRLFQPLDAYMAFNHAALLEALRLAMKVAVPQYVLDIGGGSMGGVAAMLAASAGAERVIVYEQFKVRAAVVRDILALNHCSEQVKVVEHDILDQMAPAPGQKPADTLVLDAAVHFGCDVFNSQLIPTVLHARDRDFLAPDVTVVPSRLELVVCLVESTTILEMEEIRQPIEGCDVSAFNRFSRDSRRIQLSSIPHRKLCQPTRCHTVDLQELARSQTRGGEWSSRSKVNLMFNTEGTMHGVVYWYEMHMPGGNVITMGPGDVESAHPIIPGAGQRCAQVTASGHNVSIQPPPEPETLNPKP
jgi:predicted O-methyltransferase YrrM